MDIAGIPVGTSDFAEIRQEKFYYIDKTALIEELLKTRGTKATLITRPRRFGKTLNMNMLSEFFDIRKDNKHLFEGLYISNNKEICNNWQNQYPVLFLTFKSVDGLDFNNAAGQLKIVLADMCINHYYLMESKKVNEIQKERFIQIARKSSDINEVKNALILVLNMMKAHYGKPVILLIDEYDVPLAKASENGYYKEMLDVIKGIMQVIKDNSLLKIAVITGCLRIAKESIFTGMNNFVSDTISDTRLNEYFGFTQKEVTKLLEDTELSTHSEEIKKWYDGYNFGGFYVYCPWDVMNHVSRLLLNPETKPAGYWKNSSGNTIIRSFIDVYSSTVKKKFETLMSGGYIIQGIKEGLTYDYIHSSEENLWSVLYFTGYLTRAKEETAGKNVFALSVPNAEVMEIFEDAVEEWFSETSNQWDKKALFDAVWNMDDKCISVEITKLLRKTISYHDYKEDFYHAFFAGIFAGAGYIVESNKEHGEGRSDIIVQDYTGDRMAVFEVKYSKSQDGLENECLKAIAQIDDKMYAKEFEEDYSQVICYGISFYKKRCMVKV
ncbi:MAG: ATP-binding protein, partial [Lachnospiraceae bacterium]|nr:ATP-binding protein [Lachnospiraceae bacterium]